MLSLPDQLSIASSSTAAIYNVSPPKQKSAQFAPLLLVIDWLIKSAMEDKQTSNLYKDGKVMVIL